LAQAFLLHKSERMDRRVRKEIKEALVWNCIRFRKIIIQGDLYHGR
jgi:hypothetical protein